MLLIWITISLYFYVSLLSKSIRKMSKIYNSNFWNSPGIMPNHKMKPMTHWSLLLYVAKNLLRYLQPYQNSFIWTWSCQLRKPFYWNKNTFFEYHVLLLFSILLFLGEIQFFSYNIIHLYQCSFTIVSICSPCVFLLTSVFLVASSS